jgi:hypothetical protein
MNITNIMDRIQDYLGVDTSDTDVSARLIRFINDARKEIAKKGDWNCLKRFYNLVIPSDVSDGTVSITADTNTVAGTSTSFASSMIGSYIQLGAEWYKITAVTSTISLTIDIPFIGSTLTGANYTIRRIFHRLPGDVSKIGEVSEFTIPQIIRQIGNEVFMTQGADYKSVTGTPYRYNICGIYGKENTYTTGSVSGTIATKTVTGAGTSFLANILPGDKFVINGDTNIYRVESIETDTSLTLVQKLTASVAALTTYTATTDADSLMVRFYYPSSRKAIIPFEYFAYPYDLIGITDEDSITRRYGELIVDYVIAKEKRATDDVTWTTDKQLADIGVRETNSEGKKHGSWPPNLSRYKP